jgi:polygalacturonase
MKFTGQFIAVSALALFCAAVFVGCDAGSARAPLPRRSIVEFGAVGDGATLNTKAIQSAIDQCSADGGATLVVPEGTFISGAIFLKQGVNLHLDAGAQLKGSTDTNDYPWIDTRIAGLEMKWPAALVNADGVTNLVLSGSGTLDGSGQRWWEEYWETRRNEPDGWDPHFKVARPRLVHIIRSGNITVRDVTMQNSAFWHLQLTYCDRAVIAGIKVRAPHEPVKAASSDGIDIDSTSNVIIADCDIVCDDDAICLKSGRDADGLRVNRPTENVLIKNCRVGHAAGLVVIGSETSGGIRNVRVTDCRAEDGCQEIVRFKTKMDRGGVVENILYENITGDGVRQVFSFNMNALAKTWLPEEFQTPVPPEIGTPVFRNITVRNIKVTNAKSAGKLTGLPQSPIIGLRLENVTLEAEQGFTVENVKQLQFVNVKLNGQTLSTPPDRAGGNGSARTAAVER